MSLSDLKHSESVLKAVSEFDALGREAFLKKYGCREAKSYYLVVNGEEYDSKAIVSAAHGYEFPELGALPVDEFSGGESTVKQKLESLGFEVVYYDPIEKREARMFGPVAGVEIGATFASRKELAKSSLHRPIQAGISGSEKDGADSIVVSGGYEDDEDFGDEIIYTGHGGNDPKTNKQVADQALTRGNLALARNKEAGLPVRVIRGANHRSSYSPQSGLRYDGLFYVDDYWHEQGRSGFRIYRFRLVRELIPPVVVADDHAGPSARRAVTSMRIIRDTVQALAVKKLYNFTCQVCGVRLETAQGPYAEAAHIRALGRPHDGPDSLDNLLCLCPNHHVLFDYGAIAFNDDLSGLGWEGVLTVKASHVVNVEHIRYHRNSRLEQI